MATIVNTPTTDRVVDSSDNGGWAVAVIVLLAIVVIGAFLWMRYYNAPAASQSQTPGSAQINLTLPSSGGSGNSGSGASNTGGTGATNSGGASAPATQ